MTDDLDCATAAAELLNRARDEEIIVAHLKATLPSMQAIAAAISNLADRGAGIDEEPPGGGFADLFGSIEGT
jgi:hypothetical protein